MKIPEIFTPEERDENDRQKRELINLVASKETVLIVGAGSSVRVGYPDWVGLLKDLEGLASICGDGFNPDERMRENDSLEYVKKIKSHICKHMGDLERYYAFLDQCFDVKDPPQELHKILVSLPFRGILTTNYDMVLETALSFTEQSSAVNNSLIVDKNFKGQVHKFLMGMSDISTPRRIAHLHGRYDNPRNIILSSKDYQEAYGLIACVETQRSKDYQEVSGLKISSIDQMQIGSEWTFLRKLLWAVLATRRVIFVGFSMKDPYFNKMLETISVDLWRWDKPIHFAIMGISSESAEDSKIKAKMLKDEYGIVTVFYEVIENSHQGLDHIIDEIAKECNIDIKSDNDDLYEDEQQISDVGSCPKTPSGLVRRFFVLARGMLEIFRQLPSKSQNELDWLEESNQRMEKRISDEN